MMDAKWGSGDPNTYLTSTDSLAYDDHNYVKYAGVAQNKDAYLAHSCADDRSGDGWKVVGEWSLSVDSAIEHTADWDPSTNVQWYKQWWAAQVMSYEKTANGWVSAKLLFCYKSSPFGVFCGDAGLTSHDQVFWTWKTTGLNDPRWDYQLAVNLGIIDKNPDVAYSMGVC